MNVLSPEVVGYLVTVIKIAIVGLLQVLIFSMLYRRMQIQKKSHRGDVSFKTYRQVSRKKGNKPGKATKEPEDLFSHLAHEYSRETTGHMGFHRRHH
ncbi:hypothetical protein [Spirosoma utsteinense]|uniref:Uncharacterized protein n=1 Tax=Spirosoma utsteinense TaxID=2585773 RepID=A0ABR6W8V1_9BACT|nr:hypothetical protein [Spirosoma utsteinense]MBC3787325.1 hypothetical protein [Spirosoma utsteinense]MBC3793011.1 hypothetical protein [Spirosoma utsteinense]